MKLAFSKMEGCGNSFVLISGAPGASVDWAALSRRICDRCFGIGSDGLLVVRQPSGGVVDVGMYNPDGSFMGMCGNGIRCVARYAVTKGILPAGAGEMVFRVEERIIKCKESGQGRIRVDMGEPCFDAAGIPVAVSGGTMEIPLRILDEEYQGSAVSMGNPHFVVLSSISAERLKEVGPLIENHKLFPKRTNVEFVECLGPKDIRVRVWERGAGLTLACGTGACASAVCCVMLGRSALPCSVHLPGGDVLVDWDRSSSNHVFLEGPAREICEGVLSDEFLISLGM